MQVHAIDPGDVHNGVAAFDVRGEERTLRRLWTRSWSPDSLYRHLENIDPSIIVVCESFHLYPELAREQGYSTFPTCERIGVVKYICAQRGLTLYMQEPGLKKRARRIGERLAPHLGSVRMIGTAKSRYRGWDFGGPSQHERDATCHGVWFGFRHKTSPLQDMDLKREAKLLWTA